MNSNRSEQSKHEQSSPTGHLRFLKAGVAALIALAVVGSISPAEAQQEAVKSYTFTGTRDMRYCEILVGTEGGIQVYNTTGVSDCPAQTWDTLDLEKIRQQFGASIVQKNGPHFWLMDTNTLSMGEKASLAGIEARWVARLDLALLAKGTQGSAPYKVFTPKKTQKMVYSKGKSVFELVDPDGHVYVMQAREEKFPLESLAKLSEQMTLPTGWTYRTRVLTEDLVLDLGPDQTIYAVGDEFHQYYTRLPKSK
jgi:hypothetical protein